MACILVADDSPDVRAALVAILEDLGHTVLAASDGQEAVRVAGMTTPDAMMLDLMMPRLDGIGALKQLRADSRTSRVPAIMISAIDDPVYKQLAARAGAQAYITKPWTAGLVESYVGRALTAGRAALSTLGKGPGTVVHGRVPVSAVA